MKNGNRAYLAGVVAVIGALYFLTNCRETKLAFTGKPEVAPNRASKENDVRDSEKEKLRKSAFGKNGSGSIDFDKSPPEKRALHMMTNLLAQSLQPEGTMDRVVELLREHNQLPTITKDDNGETGEMFTVRTQAPYQGTRYFHAQYFTNPSDQTKFVQHMSFEFRPGPAAMREAVAAVKTNFPGLGEPTSFSEELITWKVTENYVVQVAKLSQEDIEEGDPFNSYEASDVGTIWVSLQLKEQDDHEHEEDNANEEDGKHSDESTAHAD